MTSDKDFCKCCQEKMNKAEIAALPIGSWSRWFFSYGFKAFMYGAIWYARRRLSVFRDTPMGKLPTALQKDLNAITRAAEKTHKGSVANNIHTVAEVGFIFLNVDNAYNVIWNNIKEELVKENV